MLSRPPHARHGIFLLRKPGQAKWNGLSQKEDAPTATRSQAKLLFPRKSRKNPYFPELSPYIYDGRDPDPNTLNVGWLSSEHGFQSAPVAPRFVALLSELAKFPTNLCRGSHLCEFCPAPPVVVRHGLKFIEPPPGTFGNGEIRVSDSNGVTYVAPVLIAHYVAEHQYLPPQTFIDAVLQQNGSSPNVA